MSFTSINLGLRELLQDPERRQEFFKSVTQDEIASQIRGLRKERALTQAVFAEKAGMKQSAVSRIEQAEYSSWTLTTLFRVAAVLNARLRLVFVPAEEAIKEFEALESDSETGAALDQSSAAKASLVIDQRSHLDSRPKVQVGDQHKTRIATVDRMFAPEVNVRRHGYVGRASEGGSLGTLLRSGSLYRHQQAAE